MLDRCPRLFAMGKKYLLMFFLIPFFAVSAIWCWAGEPKEGLQRMTDRIISILVDPNLEAEEMTPEKIERIYETVDGYFHWDEIGRRTLSRHWQGRTPEEKEEFISLFKGLLKKTYLKRVREYSGQSVTFGKEIVDGKYGLVKSEVIINKGEKVDVVYKLKQLEKNWLIYDISVEGVSLIHNYRVQFDSVIRRSSYNELVNLLRKKVVNE